VLLIVGEPSQQEKIYASSLDLSGCDAVTSGARNTISYKEKLLHREHGAEIALSRDYHRFARGAAVFSMVKILSVSSIVLFLLFVLLRRIL
jgi:hypothetical protein